jgi:subtilisin family serine protease
MKQISLLNVTLLTLGLVTTTINAQNIHLRDVSPLPAVITKIINRYDLPVVSGVARRSWTWGDYFASETEGYQEAPGGKRTTYYFDKGRLEITDPGANPNSEYYATSGLLLKEMITGQVQLGDNIYQAREPARVVVAGDNPPLVDTAPTYADLQELVSFDGSWRAADLAGQTAGLFLLRGGNVDSSFMQNSSVKYAQYDENTGHNIADVFLKFMNSTGPIYNGSQTVNGPIYNSLYVFGRPISEPYWTLVTVAGIKRAVLIQAFERRLLTYTPDNSPEFQVELGNIGRAYYQWRYSPPGPAPAADPAIQVPASTPALEFYTKTLKNLNTLSSMRFSEFSNTQRIKLIEYEAPDKRFYSEQDELNCGKGGYYTEIAIGQRLYASCQVDDKAVTDWVCNELPAAFKWPNYSDEVNLNELDLSYSFGPDGKAGNEPTRSIIKTKLDNRGYNLSSTVAISTVSGLPLEGSTSYDFKDQRKVYNVRYDGFNQSFNISPPAGANNSGSCQPQPASSTSQLLNFSEEANSASSFFVQSMFRERVSTEKLLAVPGEIIVKFRADSRNFQPGFTSELPAGFSWQSWTATNRTALLKGDPNLTTRAIEQLKANPAVEYAEPNYLYYPEAITEPDDEQYPNQWYLKAVKAPRAWSVTTGQFFKTSPASEPGQILIAVIDTGVQADHPDLQPGMAGNYDLYDGRYPNEDPVGHGTLVAGIISAQGNNHAFGSGLAWRTKLLSYRVGDRRGISCQASANAIRDATDRGARVINLSFGNSVSCETLAQAIAYALQKGAVIVAAAGNDGSDKLQYPSAYPGVISVAAAGKLGKPTSFSNYGAGLTLVAPGVDICNTTSSGRFGCDSGTSFSAPIVSGTVALMLAVNPNLTPSEIKAILVRTATPPSDKAPGSYDPHYGYGSLNTFAAVRAVATSQRYNLPAGVN